MKDAKRVNLETTTKRSLKACATSASTANSKKSNEIVINSFKDLRLFYQARRAAYLSPPSKEQLYAYDKVNKVPLKEEDHKSWLDFKKIDEGRPRITIVRHELWEKGRWPINLDHPLIPVISDFAVAAFNVVRDFHVKKSYNICHYQVMDCKYINMCSSHCFYITMEVIEEGILGVYSVLVGCNYNDGSRTLVNFILTDHTPTGKIAMMLPCLIRLKSKYETLKGMKKDLEVKMETVAKSMEGKNERKVAAARLIRLKKEHKAMKGKCNKLYRQIRSQIPKTWNDRNDGDSDWQNLYPYRCGLKYRKKNPSCKGYDYYSNANEFAIFAIYH